MFKQRVVSLCVSLLVGMVLAALLFLQLPAIHHRVYGASILVDGIVDAAYGAPAASDQAGDGNGNAVMDLLDLYIAEDADYFYFAFTINADISGGNNWGKYAIYIDTTNDANGATSDAWTRSVVVSDTHKPEYGIYTWVDQSPYNTTRVQFWRWTGSSWTQDGTIVDAALSTGVTSTIEWQVARSALGDPDEFWCEAWSTGGGGGDNAQDTINDPSEDWNASDWTTQAVLANSTHFVRSYFGPALDIAAPTEGQHVVYSALLASGTVSPTTDVTVTINLNGASLYTPTVDALGAFSQSLILLGGGNVITFSATNISGTATVVRHVTYGPALTLALPTEGQYVSAPHVVPVQGVAQPSDGVTVTVQLDGGPAQQASVNAVTGAFSTTVTPGSSGPHTITVSAFNASGAATAVRHVTYGAAAHDNDIWWGCLGHNTHDLAYRDPFGARPTESIVTLRLRACKGDLTGATLHVYLHERGEVAALPMSVSSVITDAVYDYWEATATTPITPTLMYYKFEAVDGSDRDWYVDDTGYDGLNGWGRAVDENPTYDAFRITVYDQDFQTPDWVKDAVIYQIFPDRFRDGDPSNNVVSGTHFVYTSTAGITYTTWNAPVINPRNPADPAYNRWSEDFYGGDLAGITAKLDYLQEMGVTALYLNPIFLAPSNHKYDTTSFETVDPRLGGDAALQALLAQARARGMRVILDGVFNHTSSDSIYFDKYSRYANDGAYESESSPYYPWYTFSAWPNGYASWWGYDTLPTLRADQAAVRAYFWGDGNASIGGRWVVSGTAGWRLDVGGDLDHGAQELGGNDYWEGFRQTVKAASADAVIVGEEWGDATPWLLGQEWDAVMNYRFRSALLSFMRDQLYWDNDNNDSSSGGTLQPITVSEFDRWLRQIQEDYPPEAWYAMMNLLGSHDTNRLRFVLSKWQKGYDGSDPLAYDPATDLTPEETDQRQMLVALLQFTLPGAPTIYYGDEVGIDAPAYWANDKWEDDPYNRVPFPWDDTPGHYQARPGVQETYARLAQIRAAHPALRSGAFETLLVDDANQIYVYRRSLGDDWAVVVINRDVVSHTVTVDLGGAPEAGAVLSDTLHGGGPYTVSGDQTVTVTVEPLDGRILVAAPAWSVYLPIVLRAHSQ